MESLFQTAGGENNSAKLSRQAVSFVIHTALAIVSWLALMFAGYALNPAGLSQTVILVLSILVPAVVGYVVTRYRQDEMATLVWLAGVIWLLIVSLWILDMPTGPNRCLQCDATEKLSRTFLSLPQPSGLIDDDGPFLGTWPAAALFGYAIGARFGLRPSKEDK
jgi:prepilin signal peptidase PulO-like enzyme (type II secretory pathway)